MTRAVDDFEAIARRLGELSQAPEPLREHGGVLVCPVCSRERGRSAPCFLADQPPDCPMPRVTELSKRDQEIARTVIEYAMEENWLLARGMIETALVAARAEERERIVKLVQDYAELWEIAVAPWVDRIRRGQ